jgi:hypothetical protein
MRRSPHFFWLCQDSRRLWRHCCNPRLHCRCSGRCYRRSWRQCLSSWLHCHYWWCGNIAGRHYRPCGRHCRCVRRHCRLLLAAVPSEILFDGKSRHCSSPFSEVMLLKTLQWSECAEGYK